jgi:anti-sigma factor (TIGR02949 family)
MECKTAQNLLEAYLDNELDRTTARELEAHADVCADCSAALGQLDELRRALREQNLRYRAPDSLRERIRTSAAQAYASVPRTPQRTWLRLAAACVLAFGAGAVSVLWWHLSATDVTAHRLTSDLFTSHFRALAATSPVDVISSDRHTVKPWFAGKVAQSPLVRDFADQGFALVGGRIDYVGSRVPVLVYKHGQHLVDVYVFPVDEATYVEGAATLDGYSIEPVTLGGQPAAIVSDMDTKELSRFAGLLSSPSAP